MWILQRGAHSGLCRQVHNHIEYSFAEDTLHVFFVAYVRSYQLQEGIVFVPGEIGFFDLRIVEIVEIVNDSYPVVQFQETIDEVAADETGSAGN
jgi:hypothetical protein